MKVTPYSTDDLNAAVVAVEALARKMPDAACSVFVICNAGGQPQGMVDVGHVELEDHLAALRKVIEFLQEVLVKEYSQA